VPFPVVPSSNIAIMGKTQRGAALAVVGVALVLVFAFASGESVNGSGWSAVPLALWWMVPVAIALFAIRSAVTAMLIAVVVVVVLSGFLRAIYRSDSSTAGIGLFTAPMLAVVIAASGVVVERLVMGRRSNAR
jgi:hypothetical protein